VQFQVAHRPSGLVQKVVRSNREGHKWVDTIESGPSVLVRGMKWRDFADALTLFLKVDLMCQGHKELGRPSGSPLADADKRRVVRW